MEAIIAQNLSPRVESAIKKILGDDIGPFDGPEFSAVDYVNAHFPDEKSLSKLDDTIADLDAEIAALDASILETVREQSTSGSQAAKDVAEAKDSIGDLHAKIKEIKRKADDSEAMVQEICRDIRLLDVAKRNLTTTINVVGRLRSLCTTVEDLRGAAEMQRYSDAATMLQAAITLFSHFADYRDVPKVSELATAVEKIKDDLSSRVDEDFDTLLDEVTPRSIEEVTHHGTGHVVGGMGRLHMTQGGDLLADGTAGAGGSSGGGGGGGYGGDIAPRQLTEDNIQVLQHACEVIDALGPRERRRKLDAFTRKQMKRYHSIFAPDGSGEAGPLATSLEGMEKRFAWFRRALREVDARHGRVFPAHWRVLHRLCLRFCEDTRAHLERILARFDPPSSAPAEALVTALMAAQKFEREMSKRFEADLHGAVTGDAAGAGAGGRGQRGSLPPGATPLLTGDAEGGGDSLGGAYDDSEPLIDDSGRLLDPNSADGIRLKYKRRGEWEKRRQEERARLAARDAKRAWLASVAGVDASAVGMPGAGGGRGGMGAVDEDIATLPRILAEPAKGLPAGGAGADGSGAARPTAAEAAAARGGGGILSAVFEPFMVSYVKRERAAIEEKVAAALAEDFAEVVVAVPSAAPANNGIPTVPGAAAGPATGAVVGRRGVLSSSSVLFAECNNAVSRCARFGMPSILLALMREVRDAWAAYTRTLGGRVPSPLPPGAAPARGTAPGSEPATWLPGDTYEIPGDPLVSGPTLADRLALIVSSADYCIETIGPFSDAMRTQLEAAFTAIGVPVKAAAAAAAAAAEGGAGAGAGSGAAARKDPAMAQAEAQAAAIAAAVDLSPTESALGVVQGSALKALSGITACLLDRCLKALVARPWDKLTAVGDSSPYVSDVARILRATVPLVRAKTSEAAFRLFSDKFAKAFLPRYKAAIFRCSRIGEIGAQQMLLDAQGIKTILKAAPIMRPPAALATAAGISGGGGGSGGAEDDDGDLRAAIGGSGGKDGPALDSEGRPLVAPARYLETIAQFLPPIEMLLKIIAAPLDRFAQTIRTHWPAITQPELVRVMELKGLSPKEQAEVQAELGFAKAPSVTPAVMASMASGMTSVLGLGGFGGKKDKDRPAGPAAGGPGGGAGAGAGAAGPAGSAAASAPTSFAPAAAGAPTGGGRPFGAGAGPAGAGSAAAGASAGAGSGSAAGGPGGDKDKSAASTMATGFREGGAKMMAGMGKLFGAGKDKDKAPR